MSTQQLTKPVVAEAGMLIRRPVEEVFEAFIDPAITAKFWFSRGSGRLEPGAWVRWDWEIYGASADVEVTAIEPNRRIAIAWPYGETRTAVEWRFDPRDDGATFVTITNGGFGGDGDAIVRAALDATDGFALVLAGLKALLEHGIALNLVPDRHPDAWVAR